MAAADPGVAVVERVRIRQVGQVASDQPVVRRDAKNLGIGPRKLPERDLLSDEPGSGMKGISETNPGGQSEFSLKDRDLLRLLREGLGSPVAAFRVDQS